MGSRPGPALIPLRLRGYVRSRAAELARPETRATSEPLAAWAQRRIRLDGKPFSFAGHEYLRALFDDTSQHIVLCKAAQIGGTTWAILRAIHSCLMGLHSMYLFPTRTDVLDFSRSRVAPLLAQNPFLARQIQDTDTVGLKKLGDSFLYLRGMQSEVGLKSVPADCITFDELDESEPAARAMALERLGHSDFKRIVELSNPSLPDYGIDREYRASDQRHWTLKCPGCGEWAAPDKEFPRKLGEEVRIIRPRQDGSHYLACPKCDAELDRAAGEWVADLPGRAVHGYLISQLHSAKVDPGEILREYRASRFPERFFNLKLGFAWADRERQLDVAAVLARCGDAPLADEAHEPTCMGVDTGSELHVVILRGSRERPRRQHLIHLGVCHDFAQLDPLMQRFQVRTCVIDGLPETHATREFARRHPEKVFLCYFNEHQRGEARWEPLKVELNRTDALDASRAAILTQQVVLPREQPIVREFAEHLSADAKKLQEDPETGVKRYRYIKTRTNHFGLAFCYAWLATTRQAPYQGWIDYVEEQLRKRRGQ